MAPDTVPDIDIPSYATTNSKRRPGGEYKLGQPVYAEGIGAVIYRGAGKGRNVRNPHLILEPLFAFQKQADLSEIDKGEIRALNSPEKLDLALAAMSNPDREVPARQAAIAVLASKDLTAIAKLAATLRSFIVTNDRSKLQRRIRADHARAIDLLASEIAVYFAHGKKETAINLFERTKALLGQFLNEKKQTITHYDFSEHGYRGLLTRQRAEAAKKAAAAWQAEENDLPSFEPDQILWWPQAARHVVYIRKAPRRAGRALEAWTRNLFDPSGRHMSGAAAQFRVARRELCKWDSREIVAAAIAALQEPAAEISPPSEETLKQALSATDPTVPARLLRDVHALTAQTTGPSEALIAAERRLTENLAERVATYVIRIRGVKRATREANPHRDLAIARIEQVLSGKFFPVGLNNFLREEGQLFARKRAASKENPSRKNRTSAKFHSGEIVVLLPAGAERTVPRDDVQKLDCESDVIRAIAALHEPVAAPPPRESMDEALRLDIVAVAGLARDLHPLAIASDPFLAWAKTPYQTAVNRIAGVIAARIVGQKKISGAMAVDVFTRTHIAVGLILHGQAKLLKTYEGFSSLDDGRLTFFTDRLPQTAADLTPVREAREYFARKAPPPVIEDVALPAEPDLPPPENNGVASNGDALYAQGEEALRQGLKGISDSNGVASTGRAIGGRRQPRRGAPLNFKVEKKPVPRSDLKVRPTERGSLTRTRIEGTLSLSSLK